MEEKRSYKILHLSTGKLFRGGERQILWLHEGLLQQNIQSLLLYRKKSALAEKKIPNSMPHTLTNILNLTGFIRFLSICRKINPDIIHCHDSRAFTFGSIVSFLLKKNIIVTKRTIFPTRPTPFNKWKYRRCNAVIAISNAVLTECKKICGDNLITIIPSGVIWNNQLYSREKSREMLGIDPDSFVIGTVGYFTSEKNISLIFTLAESLKESRPDVTIVCIGKLTDRAQKKAEMISNIVITGVLEKPVSYYNAFDMYISTSTKEGLGSALIDAVVRDIPTVALDSGGSRDILPVNSSLLIESNGPDEFTRTVKNGIDNYKAMIDQVKPLGSQARKTFSLSDMIFRYIKLYKNILNVSSH